MPNKPRQQAQAAADKATEAANRATKAVQEATVEINRVSDHLDQMIARSRGRDAWTPALARKEGGQEGRGQQGGGCVGIARAGASPSAK